MIIKNQFLMQFLVSNFWVSFRTIQEYIKIDEEKLYQFLENLDNFVEFAMQIEKYL